MSPDSIQMFFPTLPKHCMGEITYDDLIHEGLKAGRYTTGPPTGIEKNPAGWEIHQRLHVLYIRWAQQPVVQSGNKRKMVYQS